VAGAGAGGWGGGLREFRGGGGHIRIAV